MAREYKNQSPTAYQRRSHLTKDDVWIRAFLKQAQVGHIATSIDGQSFINPSTFWYDEANHQVIFHSNVAGRVRSNIEANPKVSLEASELGRLLPSNVALEFSLQFRSVIIFGTTRIISDPSEARKLLYGLIGKYFPKMTAGREYREITDKELRATSIYAIKIESWSGKENWTDRADQSDEWTALDEKWFELSFLKQENKMPENFRTEEFKVEGEKILAKIKELIHEGNIRKVIIKDKDGKIMLEIPMTFGVVGVLIAPQLAAIGAIAALLTEATIVVEKTE